MVLDHALSSWSEPFSRGFSSQKTLKQQRLDLWSGRAPNSTETLKQLKRPKSDPKWLPGSHRRVTQKWLKNHYRANGRGRSGGQTAGGDSKAFPRRKWPLFTMPALRALESACRVSILWDAVTVPTVCFSGFSEGRRGGGSAAACNPNPPRPFARYRKNDSNIGSGVTCESILGHFGVGLPESHLNHFWVA